MQLKDIRTAATHDLRQFLRSDEAEKIENAYIEYIIRLELDVRHLINTSALEGFQHVTSLELRFRTTPQLKMIILAEANAREENGENGQKQSRSGLLKKIQAALTRLEKKHGLRVIENEYDEDDATAPWDITGTYNQKIHAPKHQHQIQGVPVDPCLRYGFDNTPNDDRPDRECADWWGRGYVTSYRNPHDGIVRYTVRCLDGGAWDRSTWHGNYSSLIEAIDHAYQITQVPMRNAS